jgi:hypothetical protein
VAQALRRLDHVEELGQEIASLSLTGAGALPVEDVHAKLCLKLAHKRMLFRI